MFRERTTLAALICSHDNIVLEYVRTYEKRKKEKIGLSEKGMCVYDGGLQRMDACVCVGDLVSGVGVTG